VKNNGIKQLRQAAEKTNDNAGDGTTTTMILAQAIIDAGLKSISAGADGIPLREGIKKGVSNIVDHIEKERVDASDEVSLAAVATISSRNTNIGKMIAKIVKEAGSDGVITMEDGFDDETSYRKVEGLRLRGGYMDEFFVNSPQRRQTVFNDVPILVTSRNITLANEMGQIMEMVSNLGKKEAVVIANGIDGDALATAVANWQKRAIYILPLRVLTYGDTGEGALKDVAAVTGATYFDTNERRSLLEITPDDFGRAEKTVTDRHETTVIVNDESLKKKRIEQLKIALKDAKEFEAEGIRERIAKLNSAMFTIKVGGRTDDERNELKTRVDDAIRAARAALDEGTVAGGGSAFYRAARDQQKPDITTDEGIGEEIVYKAILAPIKQMALNSGYNLDKSDLKAIENKNKAIDFKDCKVVDAYKAGILDPFKVIREELQNAASMGASFLTLGGIIVQHEVEKDERI
jgi:chaperonin GroEL